MIRAGPSNQWLVTKFQFSVGSQVSELLKILGKSSVTAMALFENQSHQRKKSSVHALAFALCFVV